MKIGLVGTSLAKGGAERSMAILSEMLAEAGFEVHTIILTDDISYSYAGRLFNLGILKGKSNDIFRRILRFRKFRKYLLQQNFDFIIDHRPKNNFYRELYYQLILYRNLSLISVVHSANQKLISKKHRIKFLRVFQFPIINVAVSKHIEMEVLRANGIKNTITIHNAFDNNWSKSSRTLPAKLKGKTYILSYGRINDDVKDFSFLIDCFEHSRLWQKNIYLVILGDGIDKEKLKAYASNKQGNVFIKFFPFTNEPFVYIENAKFISLTSKFEGFPMVLIESLSLGTPVVALDIKSGPNEIIKNEYNGLLVSDRKKEDFTNAIRRMFFDEELYDNCKKNSKVSVLQFSKKKIKSKWIELLISEKKKNGSRFN